MNKGIPKGATNRVSQRMEIKQEPRYLGKQLNSQILPDNPKIINQHGNVIIAWDGATWHNNVQHL